MTRSRSWTPPRRRRRHEGHRLSGALVGIDVRPADGMLYGLVEDGTVVTIAMDGKATQKSKLDTMWQKA